MTSDDIDSVCEYLKSCPDLKSRIRTDPLQVRIEGRWVRATEIQFSSRGLILRIRGNRQIRIAPEASLTARRDLVRETLIRLILDRLKPGRLVSIAQETDRTRHHTAAFMRLRIERGNQLLPVIAVRPEEPSELQPRLMVSLILWWEELRINGGAERIYLFLPDIWPDETEFRLSRLRIPVRSFRYDILSGKVLPACPQPPLLTAVDSPYEIHWKPEFYPPLFADLKSEIPQLDLLYRKCRWELSYRGFPLAWAEIDGRIRFHSGFGQTPDAEGFRQWVGEIRRIRSYPPPDPRHPVYRYRQERWLESLVLQNLIRIDPSLDPEIYCQVPTRINGERRVLDLLGVTGGGRLAVIELKAEKDLSLLFQGLEYWERVKLHLEREDFQRAGYFRSRELKRFDPLLYLVTPFSELHRTYPVLARHLQGPVPCRLVGISSNWKRGLKIIRRIDLALQV